MYTRDQQKSPDLSGFCNCMHGTSCCLPTPVLWRDSPIELLIELLDDTESSSVRITCTPTCRVIAAKMVSSGPPQAAKHTCHLSTMDMQYRHWRVRSLQRRHSYMYHIRTQFEVHIWFMVIANRSARSQRINVARLREYYSKESQSSGNLSPIHDGIPLASLALWLYGSTQSLLPLFSSYITISERMSMPVMRAINSQSQTGAIPDWCITPPRHWLCRLAAIRRHSHCSSLNR